MNIAEKEKEVEALKREMNVCYEALQHAYDELNAIKKAHAKSKTMEINRIIAKFDKEHAEAQNAYHKAFAELEEHGSKYEQI